MHPGEYYHFGLLNGLKGAIDKKCLPRIRNAISIEFEILINVDGLPIFSNSTSKQLWIILGIIRGIDGLEKYHFIIGIYFGLENPTGGPNTFLRAFVNDIKDVLEHGFFHCERLFNVTALQNSCSKCTIVGFTALKPSELRRQVRPKGRVVFSCLAAPRRDKRQRDDPEHHNNYSIIEELELVDIFNDFPVDPMHYHATQARGLRGMRINFGLIFRAAQQLIGQPQDDEPTRPNVEVSVEVRKLRSVTNVDATVLATVTGSARSASATVTALNSGKNMPRKRNNKRGLRGMRINFDLIFRAAQQLIGQPQDDEPTEPNVEVSVEVRQLRSVTNVDATVLATVTGSARSASATITALNSEQGPQPQVEIHVQLNVPEDTDEQEEAPEPQQQQEVDDEAAKPPDQSKTPIMCTPTKKSCEECGCNCACNCHRKCKECICNCHSP
ncbi:hypothetical protein DAPPUDRAFT_105781 [Daphnia pulex]|uniref:Uncharacterized protein n=1 Tax=Daphnia pulex TaxID=6669 RepID=E9GRT3_DAPPU|nr:hypothetical protein DAPPUDRAFT_105781 [Daphnia pulex]|eukprot:EFX77830.1 hypothetical protein DAPPUDRAFT_105781 [Daphnia pulex]